MSPVIKAALLKAGIYSTISLVIRNAPTESFGLDVMDFHTEMGTSRTAFFYIIAGRRPQREEVFAETRAITEKEEFLHVSGNFLL